MRATITINSVRCSVRWGVSAIRRGTAPRDAEQRKAERDADNRQREREPAQERWQPGDRQDHQAETGKKDDVPVHRSCRSGAPVPSRKLDLLMGERTVPSMCRTTPCPHSGECVRPSSVIAGPPPERSSSRWLDRPRSLPCAQPVTARATPRTALNVATVPPAAKLIATLTLPRVHKVPAKPAGVGSC